MFLPNIAAGMPIASKDKIAEFMKTTPEALDEFEAAYYKGALSQPEDTGSLFDTNAKEASEAVRSGNFDKEELDQQYLQGIMSRITEDLLAFYGADGNLLPCGEQDTVTNDDLKKIPAEFRPQLTGTAIKQDLGGPSSYNMVLYMLMQSMEEKDPKMAQEYYHLFRQGLDILDLDPVLYQVLGMNRNSMGHWFPSLKEAAEKHGFFRIPETRIAKVPLPILQLSRLDYMSLTPSTLKIVDDWAMKAFDLDVQKTYFIKTGTYSSKFDFRNAKVTGEKEVRELGEYLLFIQNQACMAAGPLSSPCIYGMSTTNEWVVREFIEDKENNPCIYKGLPLHTEYRAFVDFDTDEILGISPYWRPDIMKQRFGHEPDADSPHNIHDYIIYQMHEETLMRRYDENVGKVLANIQEMLPDVNLTGQWSLDVMQNGEDFWLIDMATADTSALRDCVPAGKLKKQPENWIPDLSGETDKTSNLKEEGEKQ